MTGGTDGVIGFDRDFFARLFAGEKPAWAAGPLRINAVLIEADVKSGQALSIEPVFRDYHERPEHN